MLSLIPGRMRAAPLASVVFVAALAGWVNICLEMPAFNKEGPLQQQQQRRQYNNNYDSLSSVMASPLALTLVGMVLTSLISILLTPVPVRTKDYHNPRSSRYKALRSRVFPPGFPNGWHSVCNAADLSDGRVKSISALGTHMVAFRAHDSGKVGVLDAFCPHLGAHLGAGGTVVGDTLKCPFHGWQFDTEGVCKAIPYTKLAVPERARTKAYVAKEILGRVFVWFDAEGRPPQWDLACHTDVERGVQEGSLYLAGIRTMEFEQHSCEMHMNSADPYHFDTLHAPLPLPFFRNFITGKHVITQSYGTGEINGEMIEKPELCSITERTTGLWFFGNKQLPVPLSAWAAAKVRTTVTFEGPTIVHFSVHTPFGMLRQIKTITPVEPFLQAVESRWYAERSVPRIVAWFFGVIGAHALNQDRTVWENKMFKLKPMWVSGDGPFPAFIRWYHQFYSEHSADVGRTSLEW
eukprot:UC1_evm2s1092